MIQVIFYTQLYNSPSQMDRYDLKKVEKVETACGRQKTMSCGVIWDRPMSNSGLRKAD